MYKISLRKNMNQFKANKLHIGILGKRNAGKSTLMNMILGQDFSIVSDTPGTTTDVNQKSMELLPIGPVVLLDTAGIDDIDELGEKRIKKTYKALERLDCAIFVCDFDELKKEEKEILEKLKKRAIPTVVIVNKSDIKCAGSESLRELNKYSDCIIETSLIQNNDIANDVKNALLKILPKDLINSKNLLYGIVNPDDFVILVVPIDKEAPKDRLILPQVQVIRNLLDNKCITLICDVGNLSNTIHSLKVLPKLVITDSQAFSEVSEIVPNVIPLTSFSIIFAHFKGDLRELVLGADKIDSLKDGDKILICESCTHHPIEDDIGRVKIPNILKRYTGKNLIFEHYSGYDFPSQLDKYSLIIHCGACMTNRAEMLNRINKSKESNVSITNYGVAIAKCLGILKRSLRPFESIINSD